MKIHVSEYLNYFSKFQYPSLFDKECKKRLENVADTFGSLETQETILEVVLTTEARSCDYSIKMITGKELVKDYWYELDSDACAQKEIQPCYFIDASALKPGCDNDQFYANVLPKFAGEERANRLLPILRRSVDRLYGKCACLFQLGVMTGRRQADSMRVFTDDLSREDLLKYLEDMGWKGDLTVLGENLESWEKYSDKGKFILDFDIYEDRISDKIGINFGTKNKKPEAIKEWLSYLVRQGLCLPGKKQDVMKWIETFPSHTPFIQNDISHFKIPFCDGKILGAKAYLRQGTRLFYDDFRAYDSPMIMNLELTTKCPLHCPQCYCDLNTGKELAYDKALYWLREGAAEGIKYVNLSGGETMCYPYLMELIQECSRLGMDANVALSGSGITKQVLEQMIDAGIKDICVSLNGSTAEINGKTRDGYSLAIRTLDILKELGYSNTCINWVMHSCNAEDFSEMVFLAERYEVKELVVMMFKPDASNQLPSVPTKEQLYQVSSFIKRYKGKVSIVSEECFSQMKALINERFFGNKNRGIHRGCGAGRDGISINVDGKLTPCRHLDIPEETLSIRQYWNQSQLLKTLREVEDSCVAPCSHCRYEKNCLPCMAINENMKKAVYMGDETCPLGEDTEEALILVNVDDEEIGVEKKLAVHSKGLLHRAFSVFLYHDDQILIQKRADGKYHSAGLWANTCCSHPRQGEGTKEAAVRRLKEEARIQCEIEEIGTFIYYTVFENGLKEYELDHVFAGQYGDSFVKNDEEASDMRYVDIQELTKDMQKNPDIYAKWFITALPMVIRYIKEHESHSETEIV